MHIQCSYCLCCVTIMVVESSTWAAQSCSQLQSFSKAVTGHAVEYRGGRVKTLLLIVKVPLGRLIVGLRYSYFVYPTQN